LTQLAYETLLNIYESQDMPWKYIHQDVTGNQPREFSGILKCARCEATNADGQTPCGRDVCKWGPYCFQHNKKLLGLKVAPSEALQKAYGLAAPTGNGLYVVRAFKKGEMVAPYYAEHVPETDQIQRYSSNKKYGLGPYALEEVNAALQRGIGSAATGAFGLVTTPPNVEFCTTASRSGVRKFKGDKSVGKSIGQKEFKLSQDNLGVKYWLRATKDIAPNEEVILQYDGDGSTNYANAFLEREARCKEFGVVCNRNVRVRRAAATSAAA
jgi:hypothetical protein